MDSPLVFPVLAIGCFVAGAVFLGAGVRVLVVARRASRWREIDAIVSVGSPVKNERGSDGTDTLVQYSYDGQVLRGRRVRSSSWLYRNDIADYIKRAGKGHGDTVRILVNPRRPQESLMDEKADWKAIAFLGVMSAFSFGTAVLVAPMI
jgi:hypothetical protein